MKSDLQLKAGLAVMVQDLDSRDKKPPMTMSSDSLTHGPGGIKSYSDFMRSLAAKYNNNE